MARKLLLQFISLDEVTASFERVVCSLVIAIKKVWKESAVPDCYFEKRFGMIAVEMGFITAEQLHEVMMIQLEEDLGRMNHRPIGQILLENAYITSDQIREVLKAIGLPVLLCLSLQGKLAGVATDAG